MLNESETAVRNAIREVYEGRITGEEIQLDGETKYLVLELGEQKFGVNLSKMTRLYETGTSLAAIKTVSTFDLSNPAGSSADPEPSQPQAVPPKPTWLQRLFRRGNER